MSWSDFALGFTLGCAICSLVGTIATYREAKKRWNKNK